MCTYPQSTVDPFCDSEQPGLSGGHWDGTPTLMIIFSWQLCSKSRQHLVSGLGLTPSKTLPLIDVSLIGPQVIDLCSSHGSTLAKPDGTYDLKCGLTWGGIRQSADLYWKNLDCHVFDVCATN